MATFPLNRWKTGEFIRNINGDSFSRAVETEVAAGRSLANADLSLLGKNGDPTILNLAGGNFTSAKMDGVNLTGADLTGANLTGANLSRSVLVRTKQHKATFTNSTETDSDQAGREGR